MSNLISALELGQSIWLDHIDRAVVTDGSLETLVREGLRGLTSNPTIFERAIAGSDAYDDAILDLLQADPDIDRETLYSWLAIQDIQAAADALRPVWLGSDGADGHVSIEVSPHLAYDTDATVDAARHLWRAVHRDNLMIKVPATRAGLHAIETLTALGISVNATLLFSVDRYVDVARAWMRGIERCDDPRRIASVASFFVSRIDGKVDPLLEARAGARAERLRGQIAIASAKTAYRRFRELFAPSAFEPLAERGARPQRLLWGSTSTKNPDYPPLHYVENLIGPGTVDTVPLHTLEALQYADAALRPSLLDAIPDPEEQLAELKALDILLDEITHALEHEGVEAFRASHDSLLETLARKRLDVTRRFAG